MAGWSWKKPAASAKLISRTSWMSFPSIQDLEGLVVEPPPFAFGADDLDVAEEMHPDLDEPRALAGLAASAP